MNLKKKFKFFEKNEVITIVDAGCAGGIDQFFKELFNLSNVKLYGFEPNKEEFSKLSNNKNSNFNKVYSNIALSDSSGYKTFFSNGTVSSLFKREDREKKYSELYDEERIQCSTLEELRKSNFIKNEIDILKIDTEGSEIPILKGCGSFLDNEILCIKLEFKFLGHVNRDKFSEIDTLLSEKGFKLMNFTLNKSANGGLEGGDCFYIFDPSVKSKRICTRGQLKKLSIISYKLGFLDYLSMVPLFSDDKLDDKEIDLINQLAKSKIYIPYIFSFKNQKIAHFFSMLSQIFMGRKIGSKSAPSPNRLLSYNKLFIPTFLPFLKKIRSDHINKITKNIKLNKIK